MSKDIRSFFAPKPRPKPVENDRDIIPVTPDVKKPSSSKTEKPSLAVNGKDKSRDKSSDKHKSSDRNKSGDRKKTSEKKHELEKDGKELLQDDKNKKSASKRHDEDVKTDKNTKKQDFKSTENGKKESKEKLTETVKQSTSKRSKTHGKDRENDEPAKKIMKTEAVDPFQETLNQVDDLMDNQKSRKNDKEMSTHHSTVKVKNETPVRNSSETKSSGSSKKRKREVDTTLDDSTVDLDEERHEKKRACAVLYKQYLNRSGPAKPGSKEVPEGKPNCFHGLSFIVTGVLESLERDEAQDIITKLGGRVLKAISGKCNYVVAGDDAGPAKLEKARTLNLNVIDEDGLLDLIREKSGLKSNEKLEKVKKSKKMIISSDEDEVDEKLNGKIATDSKINEKKPNGDSQKLDRNEEISKKREISRPSTSKTPKKVEKRSGVNVETAKPEISQPSTSKSADKSPKSEKIPVITEPIIHNLPWVDKYKPKSIKNVIGQQTDNSCGQKLIKWLRNWFVNRTKKHAKPSPWAKSDDGAFFKAALLSGPPGIGKTTTVQLACKELGFDLVEFNASDTRNKKLIQSEVGSLSHNQSLANCFNATAGNVTKKRVLVMDEVDGMSGNEDRGGMQELIQIIKTSSIPVICICNDRNHEKIRSLANHCFDLRFTQPKLEAIRAALMSVCFKEAVKVKPEVLNEIIQRTNCDIRQSLNQLSFWVAGLKCSASANAADIKGETLDKNLDKSSWEVVRQVFSSTTQTTTSIYDKSDLFFTDYNLIPLFVQENYLGVKPNDTQNQLTCIAKTARSISMSECCEKLIRTRTAWGLLPTQALLSTVMPGHYMSGRMTSQINFPAWFGKNSKRSKFQRYQSELNVHMSLRISGGGQAVNMDYVPYMMEIMSHKLKNDNVEEVVGIMQEYSLLREDFTSMEEMTVWPGTRNLMADVSTKTKASFTRMYNKVCPALPFAPAEFKKKKGATSNSEEYADEFDDDDDDEEDDNVANDKMIKIKTTAKKETIKKPETKPAAKKPAKKTVTKKK